MLENSSYKLYYYRSNIIDQSIHNNRLDMIICDKTVKEAYLLDVAVSNIYNFHSTITEKLQNYTYLKGELIRIWHLKVIWYQ
jgi:hypothetical protein